MEENDEEINLAKSKELLKSMNNYNNSSRQANPLSFSNKNVKSLYQNQLKSDSERILNKNNFSEKDLSNKIESEKNLQFKSFTEKSNKLNYNNNSQSNNFSSNNYKNQAEKSKQVINEINEPELNFSGNIKENSFNSKEDEINNTNGNKSNNKNEDYSDDVEIEEEEEYEEEEEEEDIYVDEDDNELYYISNKGQSGNTSEYDIINRGILHKQSHKNHNHLKFEEYSIDEIKENRLKEIIGYLKVQKQPFDEGDLSRIFDRLDKDGNKKVSSEELKKFLYSLRTPINDFYVDKIIKEFDANDDGDIDKKEFIDKMNMQVDKINENDLTELWEVFKLFDANHDDIICYEDLMNVFMALGESVSETHCLEMIKFLSDENKGGIDFSKFFELVKDDGKR